LTGHPVGRSTRALGGGDEETGGIVDLLEILGRQEVVARPGDIGDPGLRCLGDRPYDRPCADRVASIAGSGVEAPREWGRRVADHGHDTGYAEISRLIEEAELEAGSGDLIGHAANRCIIDGGWREFRFPSWRFGKE